MRFAILFTAIVACLLVVLVDATKNDAGRPIYTRAEKKLMKKRSYSGTGTFFNPSTEGGSVGACGGYEADSANIVALNAKQYGDLDKKSGWCGKKVKISYNGKSTYATIKDACPECKYGDLDLTHTVFKALENDMDKGVIDIDWSLA